MVIVDAVALTQQNSAADNESVILQKILAAYPASYRIEGISRNRARQWVKDAINACMPWLMKTAARQQDFLFTLPYMVEDSLQLVLKTESKWHPQLLQLQRPDQAMSLADLLSLKPSPVIGIELNRSYGDTLDKLLAQRQAGWSVYTRTTASGETGSMLPMLARDFIDATLEYRKVAQRTDMALAYFPLQEAEPVNLVYFACSKGDTGQRVVNLLNQVIRAKSQQADYQQLALQGVATERQQLALAYWLEIIAAESLPLTN